MAWRKSSVTIPDFQAASSSDSGSICSRLTGAVASHLQRIASAGESELVLPGADLPKTYALCRATVFEQPCSHGYLVAKPPIRTPCPEAP